MNKEEIHDSQISPLMAEIIAICKANKIAMLASFHIPTDEDPGLECTTALLTDEFEPPRQLLDAVAAIRAPLPSPLMVTTKDANGSVVRMDAIL